MAASKFHHSRAGGDTEGHLGNDVGVVGVDAGVVKADGGGLDWAPVQLDGAEVQGDARVGRCVFQRVQPCAVAGLVENIIALDRALQDQARLAPAQQSGSLVTFDVIITNALMCAASDEQ